MLKPYHPYNPGYSLPQNVYVDDVHRVETTKPLPRRTIDDATPWYNSAHPWNSGYAVPEYVKREDPGDAVFSRPLPRKTVNYLDEESMRRALPGTGGWASTPVSLLMIIGVGVFFFWKKK